MLTHVDVLRCFDSFGDLSIPQQALVARLEQGHDNPEEVIAAVNGAISSGFLEVHGISICRTGATPEDYFFDPSDGVRGPDNGGGPGRGPDKQCQDSDCGH